MIRARPSGRPPSSRTRPSSRASVRPRRSSTGVDLPPGASSTEVSALPRPDAVAVTRQAPADSAKREAAGPIGDTVERRPGRGGRAARDPHADAFDGRAALVEDSSFEGDSSPQRHRPEVAVLSGREQKLAALIRLGPLEGDIDAIATGNEVGNREPAIAGHHRDPRGPERAARPEGSAAASAASGNAPVCTVRSSNALAAQRTRAPAAGPPPPSRTRPLSRAPLTSSSVTGCGGVPSHLDRRRSARQVPRAVRHQSIRTWRHRSGREPPAGVRPHHRRKRVLASGARHLQADFDSGQSHPGVVDDSTVDRVARLEGKMNVWAPSVIGCFDIAGLTRGCPVHHRAKRVAAMAEAGERERATSPRDGFAQRAPLVGGQQDPGAGHWRSTALGTAAEQPPLPVQGHRDLVTRHRHRRAFGGREPGGLDDQTVAPGDERGRPEGALQVGRRFGWPSFRPSENSKTRASGTARPPRSTTRPASATVTGVAGPRFAAADTPSGAWWRRQPDPKLRAMNATESANRTARRLPLRAHPGRPLAICIRQC